MPNGEREPERALSGVLSIVVHLAFLGMLLFTVTWQRKLPEPVSVDLWQDLPSTPGPKALPPPKEEVRPPPPPREEVKPPPPPPPKVEPKPAPPPKPEPKPAEPPKPDIALKEKLEKEKREKERHEQEKIERERREKEKIEKQKRIEELRELEEQKKLEKQQKLEQAKRAEEQKKLEKQAKLEEQRKFEEIRARETRELAAAQARREQAAAASAAQGKSDAEAIARIRSRIRNFIVLPQELHGNPEAEFDVVVLPGGDVLSVKLVKSSGVAAYDSAVERAILKAQPLPVPSEPASFARFRNLHLKFRPNE